MTLSNNYMLLLPLLYIAHILLILLHDIIIRDKQGRKRPLDTPKRMMKRIEREGKRVR